MEARRLRAARLFAAGGRQAEVVRRLGVSRQTASRWHKVWRERGAQGLRAAGRAGRKPRLDRLARLRLAEALLKGPRAWGFATELWTLERVAAVIRKTCRVRYSPSQVWRILGQMHWSRQRPARRARQRDERAIARWVRSRWPVVKKKPPA
jgi:transposase